jgi:hypothetical protein
MKTTIDNVTLGFKKATDIMLVKNPEGSSMGFLAGVVFYGVFEFFAPTLGLIKAVKISALKWFHFVALGIFGFNVKRFFSKEKLPSEIENRLKLIQEMRDSGKITQSEAQLLYHSLAKHYVESVNLNDDIKNQTEALQRILSN